MTVPGDVVLVLHGTVMYWLLDGTLCQWMLLNGTLCQWKVLNGTAWYCMYVTALVVGRWCCLGTAWYCNILIIEWYFMSMDVTEWYCMDAWMLLNGTAWMHGWYWMLLHVCMYVTTPVVGRWCYPGTALFSAAPVWPPPGSPCGRDSQGRGYVHIVHRYCTMYSLHGTIILYHSTW